MTATAIAVHVCDHETDRCTGPVRERIGACPLGHTATAQMCSTHAHDDVVCWSCWREAGVLLIRLGDVP